MNKCRYIKFSTINTTNFRFDKSHSTTESDVLLELRRFRFIYEEAKYIVNASS